jgi:hypothetical protein
MASFDAGTTPDGPMSEYQYCNFQAIDRPLGEADRQALRSILLAGADHGHKLHESL